MTPIEIFEYKKRWQRNHHYSVRLHSDLQSKGKEWCKVQLMKKILIIIFSFFCLTAQSLAVTLYEALNETYNNNKQLFYKK